MVPHQDCFQLTNCNSALSTLSNTKSKYKLKFGWQPTQTVKVNVSLDVSGVVCFDSMHETFPVIVGIDILNCITSVVSVKIGVDALSRTFI